LNNILALFLLIQSAKGAKRQQNRISMQNLTPELATTAATAAGCVRSNQRLLGAVLAFMALLLLPLTASAEAIPALNVLEVSDDGTEYSLSLQLLLLMTVLALLPSILILMTSFTRIIIVLSLLRQALGTAQTPPNQVLIGIALFLSLFIMAPVLENVYEDAFMPVQEGEISFMQGIENARIPLQEFMVAQTREQDVLMFMEMAEQPAVERPEDIPFTVLMPAFITSELKTAFTIGFLIYIPFIIIDLVVASVLMSMGMMMLSPMMISLPFKLLLFVLVDGWGLITSSLVATFLR
jgi:flagellar biosynthetic protein FliP